MVEACYLQLVLAFYCIPRAHLFSLILFGWSNSIIAKLSIPGEKKEHHCHIQSAMSGLISDHCHCYH
ncbi:hypothetical protein L2E82_13212 [Cichorium intybus]|uniref:Uncharacterized protein n=1 Tax=Cichorium intybus TaxID=13427 RepID=A0ACB9GJ04_CICIN|nr:hypothetical protein L2E82_13212 [Cichorium intybus]